MFDHCRFISIHHRAGKEREKVREKQRQREREREDTDKWALGSRRPGSSLLCPGAAHPGYQSSQVRVSPLEHSERSGHQDHRAVKLTHNTITHLVIDEWSLTLQTLYGNGTLVITYLVFYIYIGNLFFMASLNLLWHSNTFKICPVIS